MQDKTAILIPEATYHVYNRANGNETLFPKEANFEYFLSKYKEHVSSIADTFCYCLMPNHFHFLIRIKNERELSSQPCQGSEPLTGLSEIDLSNFLSRQFSHLFNGYTQAINKQQNRKGSLFMRPFKRKRVTDEKYLTKLVHYIHYNPVEAKLAQRPEDWKYSSFKDFINETRTDSQIDFVLKNEVIDWFEDLENFIHCHLGEPQELGVEM